MLMKSVILVLSCIVHVAVALNGVPVFMWGNDGLTSRLPVPLAGHTLQSDAFKRNYLDLVMPCKGCEGHNVVVFLRQKLSMEDVTQFGDVFGQNEKGGSFNNLKGLMEKEDSLSLAAVDNIAESLGHLKSLFGNNVHHLDSVSEVEKVPFDKTSRLLLLELEEDSGLPLEKRLAASDEMVGAVVRVLEAKKIPYTALFTAERSSGQEERDAPAAASSRHLLAAEEAKPVNVNISDCFLMYYTGLSLSTADVNATSIKAGNTIPITGEPNSSDSKCSNNTAEIILKYAVTGQKFRELSVTIEIEVTPAQYWSVKNMTLSLDKDDKAMDVSNIDAPLSFSYACGDASIRNIRKTKGQEDVFLTFQGFQIQAFKLDNGRFGYPNDCTPFFSIGILAGLIVAFILIAILSFGLIMVANITTMDRFDDPKGQPLNTNVQEK